MWVCLRERGRERDVKNAEQMNKRKEFVSDPWVEKKEKGNHHKNESKKCEGTNC